MTSLLTQRLFPLEPEYRERVWGGRRLKAQEPPVGEAWVAFEESRVRTGTHAGRTLAELAAEYGAELVGAVAVARFGVRFPVLVKLLDCADWLSVQVHPDDEQAARLVGPGASGKTEAWHFLEAEPGATIYAGTKPGTTREELEAAIRAGRVLEVARQLEVRAGETYLLPAGTLHSLGPGLLLYEVQQASDTTYRVYDWDRPARAGRELHIEESVAVTDPRKAAVLSPTPELTATSSANILSCPYFALDALRIEDSPLKADTAKQTFHVLTVSSGAAHVTSDGETVRLGTHETALVAGHAGAYEIGPDEGAAELLRASVPVDCIEG